MTDKKQTKKIWGETGVKSMTIGGFKCESCGNSHFTRYAANGCCSTHARCKCGELVESKYDNPVCESCKEKKAVERILRRYNAAETVAESDAGVMVYDEEYNKYFGSVCEYLEWCEYGCECGVPVTPAEYLFGTKPYRTLSIDAQDIIECEFANNWNCEDLDPPDVNEVDGYAELVAACEKVNASIGCELHEIDYSKKVRVTK
ncbi:MAG: hypothetical protein GY841_02875 [FCB group bacterium]|nr:hypothetical protein [FCB group bacterium]